MLNIYKLHVTVLQVAEGSVWRAGVRRGSEAARRALTYRTRVRFSILPITLSLILSFGLFLILLLRRSKIIVFHTESRIPSYKPGSF